MKNISKIDKLLFFLTALLFGFGSLMILSASNMESFVRYKISPYFFFIRQIEFLFLGFIGFLIIISIPTKNYKKFIKFLMYGILIFLIFLFMYGKATNGAFSWVKIGGFSLQPSEFIKIIFIMYAGVFYYDNKNKLSSEKLIIAIPILVGLVAVGLIAIQPDFGTAFILLVIIGAIFFSLPIKSFIKKNLIMAFAIIIILTGFFFTSTVVTDEIRSRFDYFHPCQDYKGDGYHVCNGYIAINNGGLFGVGFGNSTQKYLYLPEAHTDFIFPIIMEEGGLFTAFIILILYLTIIFRIFRISRRSCNLRNAIIAYGVAIYISIHIFVNLLGVFGRIPLTGVPLPFLSYGGSFALSLIAALAIVQRIEIENKLERKRKTLKSRK